MEKRIIETSFIASQIKTPKDLEKISIAYTEAGEAIKGERLQRWAFDLIMQAIILQDKLHRRNMQIKELKKTIQERDKGIEHLNNYYSQAENFIESKNLGTEWRRW